ncbi:2TM domain-containing protein [Kribbella sp. NBC_00889]|uniref:2TM domain-containing protein n=1 Tax=Kribbella sp. NBC_00889 TaxID=2975974 RepID=UPI00386C0B94|nr:2TM domain-containing protein [Kribbella sp. NBC_00889]
MLHDHEAAERAIARDNATIGVVVHGIITLLVGAGLIVVNITLAPELPWSVFAVGGMLIGLLAHWWFGYVKLDEQFTKQQQTEARAARSR